MDSLAAFVIASFVVKSFFTAVTSPEFEHALCLVVYRDQVTGERFPHRLPAVADWRTVGEHLGLDGDVAVDRVASIVKQVPVVLDAASRQVAVASALDVAIDWEAALAGYHMACNL